MAIEITETLHPKTPKEWHRWLARHHATKTEIWVIFYKKHTGKQTVTLDDAVSEALCFGWIDGIEKRLDNARYALRFTPRKKRSNWSAPNIARYQKLLKAGKITPAGVAAYARKDIA